MESKILLSLLVLLLGLSGAFSLRTLRKHVCQSECGVAIENGNYTVGRQYIYEYSTSVTNSDFINRRLSKKRRESSVSIDVKVAIEVISKCQMALTITKVKLETDSTYDVSLTKEEVGDEKEIVDELQRSPLFFRFENGYIDNLCSVEPVWVRNFKRGILSSLHNTIGLLKSPPFVEAMVTDVNGRCPTRFERLDAKIESDICRYEANLMCNRYPSRRFQSGDMIIAQKDLAGCRNHMRTVAGFMSTPYQTNSPVQHLPLSDTYHRCESIVRNGIIADVICAERFDFPIGPKSSVARTYISKTLSLIFSSVQACGPACMELKKPPTRKVRYRQGSLMFEFETRRERIQNKESEAEKLLCQLVTTATSYQDAPRHLLRLTKLMRAGLGAALLRRSAAICPDADAEYKRKILLDIAQAAGTPEGIDFILKEKGTSQQEKDRRLATMAFIKEPSRAMLESLGGTIKNYGGKFRRAAQATADLIYRYCAGSHNCWGNPAVATITKFVRLRLTVSCLRPNKDTVALLNLVGNLGADNVMVASLNRCAVNRRSSNAVKVAALNAFRRAVCARTSTLLSIVGNVRMDTEIRIAAYRAFMRCPSSSELMKLRSMMVREPSYHVARYIETHLANLRQTSDPSLQNLRYTIQDIHWSFPRRKEDRPFAISGNYERSFFSPSRNLGGKIEADLIWSEKEAYPRSVYASITAFLFSQKVNFLEVEGRQEGYNNLRQIFPNIVVKDPWKEAIKNKTIFDASLYVRVFGHEVFSLADVSRERLLMNIRRPYMLLETANKWKLDIRQNSILADASATIATSAGLPFTLNLRSAASTSVKGHSTYDSSKQKFKYSYALAPYADVTVEMDMSVDIRRDAFGLKFTGTGHTSTSMGIAFETIKGENGRRELNYEFVAPRQLDVLTLRWESLYLHQSVEIPTDVLNPQPQVVGRYMSATAEKVIGYQAFFSINRPIKDRLFSSNEIKLFVKRMDKFEKMVIRSVVQRRELSFNMDTPGSSINRKISGRFVVDANSVKMNMTTPWKTIDLLMFLRSRFWEGTTLIVFAKSDTKTYVDVKVRAKRTMIKRMRMWNYEALARFGDVKFLTLEGVTNKSYNYESYRVVLTDPLRSPITITGEVKTIKANKVSIGKQRNTVHTIDSPFLKSKIAGTFEVAKRKYSSKVQIDYDVKVMKDAKGTISSKMRWTRIRDSATKDIFVSEMAFSQFPYLNSDLTVKSTSVSLANFRHDLVLKYGKVKTPVTARLDLASGRGRQNTPTIKFEAAYSIPRFSSAGLNFTFINNRESLSTSTGFLHKVRGKTTVDLRHSFINKGDRMTGRKVIRNSLTFSSEYTDYGLSSSLLNDRMKNTFRLAVTRRGALTQPFGLTTEYKFRKSLSVHMNVNDWVGRYSIVRQGRRISAAYTFSENSRYLISLRGLFSYRSRNFTFQETAKSGSERLYAVVLQASYFRRIPKGMFDLMIGHPFSERRFKASFMHSRRKHVSEVQVKTLKTKAVMNNKYDFTGQATKWQISGTSELNLSPGKKLKRVLLTSKYTSSFTSEKAESRLDFDDRFVAYEFQISPRRKFSVDAKVTSSFPVLKRLQLSHQNEFKGRLNHDFVTQLEYASASSKRSISFNSTARKEGDVPVASSNIKSKLDDVTDFSYSAQHRYSGGLFKSSVDVWKREIGQVVANLTTDISRGFRSTGSVLRKPDVRVKWTVAPSDLVEFSFVKLKKGSSQKKVDVSGRLAMLGMDVDVKGALDGDTFLNVSTSADAWRLRLKTAPLKIRPVDLGMSFSRQMCSHKTSLYVNKLVFSNDISFCERGRQKVLIDARLRRWPVRIDYYLNKSALYYNPDSKPEPLSLWMNAKVADNFLKINFTKPPQRRITADIDLGLKLKARHTVSVRHWCLASDTKTTVTARLPSLKYSYAFAQLTGNNSYGWTDFSIRTSGKQRLMMANMTYARPFWANMNITVAGKYEVALGRRELVDLADFTMQYFKPVPYATFLSPFLRLKVLGSPMLQMIHLQPATKMSYRGVAIADAPNASVTIWDIMFSNKIRSRQHAVINYHVRKADRAIDVGEVNFRIFKSPSRRLDVGMDVKSMFVKGESRLWWASLYDHFHELKYDVSRPPMFNRQYNISFYRISNVTRGDVYVEQKVNTSIQINLKSGKEVPRMMSRKARSLMTSFDHFIYSYSLKNDASLLTAESNLYLYLMEKRVINGRNEYDYALRIEPRNKTLAVTGRSFGGWLAVPRPDKFKASVVLDSKDLASDTQRRLLVRVNGWGRGERYTFMNIPRYDTRLDIVGNYIRKSGAISYSALVTVDEKKDFSSTKRKVHLTAQFDVNEQLPTSYSNSWTVKDVLSGKKVSYVQTIRTSRTRRYNIQNHEVQLSVMDLNYKVKTTTKSSMREILSSMSYFFNGKRLLSGSVDLYPLSRKGVFKYKTNSMKKPFALSVIAYRTRIFTHLELKSDCGDIRKQLFFQIKRRLAGRDQSGVMVLRHVASNLDIKGVYSSKGSLIQPTSAIVIDYRLASGKKKTFRLATLSRHGGQLITFQLGSWKGVIVFSQAGNFIQTTLKWQSQQLFELSKKALKFRLGIKGLGTVLWFPGRVIVMQKDGSRLMEKLLVTYHFHSPYVIHITAKYSPRRFFSGLYTALSNVDATCRSVAEQLPGVYDEVKREVLSRRRISVCSDLPGLRETLGSLSRLPGLVTLRTFDPQILASIRARWEARLSAAIQRVDGAVMTLVQRLARARTVDVVPTVRRQVRRMEMQLVRYSTFPFRTVQLAARETCRSLASAYDYMQNSISNADLTQLSVIHERVQATTLDIIRRARDTRLLKNTAGQSAIVMSLNDDIRDLMRTGVKMYVPSRTERNVKAIFDAFKPTVVKSALVNLMESARQPLYSMAISSVESYLWRLLVWNRDSLRMLILPPKVVVANAESAKFSVIVFLPRLNGPVILSSLRTPPFNFMTATKDELPLLYKVLLLRHSASLIDGVVTTFDGKMFDLPMTCSYTLSRSVDQTWAVLLKNDGGKRQLLVRIRGDEFSLSWEQPGQTIISLNGKPVDLPYYAPRYSQQVYISDGNVVFYSYNSFTLIAHLRKPDISLKLVRPNRKVIGLFGNADNEPNNDWPLRASRWNQDLNAYLRSLRCGAYARPVQRTCPHLLRGRPPLKPGQNVELQRIVAGDVVFAVELGSCWQQAVMNLPDIIATLARSLKGARFGFVTYNSISAVPVTVRYNLLAPASAFTREWARLLTKRKYQIQRVMWSRRRSLSSVLKFYPFRLLNQHHTVVMPCYKCPKDLRYGYSKSFTNVHLVDNRYDSQMAFLRKRRPQTILGFNRRMIYMNGGAIPRRYGRQRLDYCTAKSIASGGSVFNYRVFVRGSKLEKEKTMNLMASHMTPRRKSTAIVCQCKKDGRLRCLTISKLLP